MSISTLNTIRNISVEDYDNLRSIHEKFYKNVFDFPNFTKNHLAAFLIENEDGIVSAAGIRIIPEITTITNKDFSVKERRKALLDILAASSYICQRNGHHQLFAFVQDSDWEQVMRKYKFVDYLGKPLVLEV